MCTYGCRGSLDPVSLDDTSDIQKGPCSRIKMVLRSYRGDLALVVALAVGWGVETIGASGRNAGSTGAFVLPGLPHASLPFSSTTTHKRHGVLTSTSTAREIRSVHMMATGGKGRPQQRGGRGERAEAKDALPNADRCASPIFVTHLLRGVAVCTDAFLK